MTIQGAISKLQAVLAERGNADEQEAHDADETRERAVAADDHADAQRPTARLHSAIAPPLARRSLRRLRRPTVHTCRSRAARDMTIPSRPICGTAHHVPMPYPTPWQLAMHASMPAWSMNLDATRAAIDSARDAGVSAEAIANVEARLLEVSTRRSAAAAALQMEMGIPPSTLDPASLRAAIEEARGAGVSAEEYEKAERHLQERCRGCGT